MAVWGAATGWAVLAGAASMRFWTAPATLGGFAIVGAVALVATVVILRRTPS